MTVKCLPAHTQNVIVELFLHNIKTIDELASMYQRSRRTIIRVLEDANVDPGIKRRKSKAIQGHVDVPLPFELPEVPKLNWFQRAFDKVVRNFALLR